MCYVINYKNIVTKETSMDTCPSCRSPMAPCLSPNCPMMSPSIPPCEKCQRCREASVAATPCLAGGNVPQFPLPYVCRHWIQTPNPAVTCCHGHSCTTLRPPGSPLAAPACQVTHIENPEKSNTLQINGACSGGTVKDLSIALRSGSPENHFILPEITLHISGVFFPNVQKTWTPQDDLTTLSCTLEALQTSGWYYGSMTWQEAATLLANKSKGTFLVRDSSSKNCPFALSVQTQQGPTSIRIEYEQGKFWLDCEKKGVTPQFSCIIKLIEYYRELSIASDSNDKVVTSQTFSHSPKETHVWIDHRGRVFSPILIVSPLRKNPPSLKHLCRAAIHSHNFPESHLRTLPTILYSFLRQYQYSL